MSYPETIEFLYGLRLFGTNLGLGTTYSLARLCGNPQNQLRFIHVAGTNGKGSVCAMLESIYRRAGLRVGLFTSPHLVSFTERLQVNRQCISEADVCRLVATLAERLGGKSANWPVHPTFFEFVTVLGLLYFAEQKCDLVIWETGLGGRLDATNIVHPLACVITNIQWDHQQWLGHTLAEIAAEKAGIIKPGVPIVTATDSAEALAVIQEAARRNGSPCTIVRQPITDQRLAQTTLSLPGDHQRVNAAVALATMDALQMEIPVAADAALAALADTSWAGRLQIIKRGANTVVLDGAHNPDGARTLLQALDQLFAGQEITLVLGLFKDKAWQEMCDLLIPRAARVYLASLQNERSADSAEVLEYSFGRWPAVSITSLPSTALALNRALAFPFVVVAGSLHLVGEAIQHLGLSTPGRSERKLNEWDAARERAHPPSARPESFP